MVVSTTRSPRVFPIQSKVSNFDQLIAKKLPQLKQTIKSDQEDLVDMVTVVEQQQAAFYMAFSQVKKQTEQELAGDKPNSKTVAFNERLDLIYVRDVDKVIEILTENLAMDL